MSDYFDEKEMQEELDILISQIIDDALDKYGTKRQPKDGSLEACLDSFTKDKLLQLAMEYDAPIKSSWRKGEIVEALHDELHYTLIERLLLIPERGLTLLQYMAEGYFAIEEFEFDRIEFMLTVFRPVVRLGLIYITEEDDEIVMSMPIVIKDELDSILIDYEGYIEMYDQKRKLFDQINEVLNAGLNLYGVISVERFYKLWHVRYPLSVADDPEVVAEQYRYLQVYSPLLVLANDHHVMKGSILAHRDIVTEEEAMSLYDYRLRDYELDDYEPSREEIAYYSQHMLNEDSLAYQHFVQEISSYLNDIDMFMTIVGRSIRQDVDIVDVLDRLAEMGLSYFETEGQLKRFFDLYTNLYKASRLWISGGHTYNEIESKVADLDAAFENETGDSSNVISLEDYLKGKN